MKISKLFHWLYAFLMFLPITFILPTLLYFGFNDNAIAQEYTKEEPVYYESNEVLVNTDFTIGNAYTWTDEFPDTYSGTYDLFGFNVTEDLFNIWFPSYSYEDSRLEMATFSSGVRIKCIVNGNWLANYSANEFTFPFVLTYITSLSNIDIIIGHVEPCYNYVSSYQDVTYTMGITDSVNQAIIDTFGLPMFSWTTNNILVAPFISICSFFGISADSVLIKYLYYWLSISIIYLCFDVIMYVPLLVHRWLDKGIVE